MGSLSAWAGVGTCVGFKLTPDRQSVTKTFMHVSKEGCDALKDSFDDVQFRDGTMHTMENCSSYSCSFPCIDHFGCTCAPGFCH